MKKLWKVLLFGLVFLITQISAIAQVVSGKITDGNYQPVPFASVFVAGTTHGTTTDEHGYYLLKLPAGRYSLQVQALGFEQAEKIITLTNGGRTELMIKLARAVKTMQEVSVSGVKVKTATATRSLMQLQDIPQAISVIGQKEIKQQAAFDLTTILRNISGLNFSGSYSGAGSSQFFNARGFDLNDTQNYRWNGMMIWNWGNNYNDNIEQVEFLKGPTSILYGDVAPGGIINLVTKKPLREFKAEINLRTGSWGLMRPAADITGPLNKNGTVRYRLNTSFEYQRSFRDFVSSRKTFVAPSLAWDITPKLHLAAEAALNRSSATDDAGLVSPNGSIAGLAALPPTLYLGEPTRRYQYRNENYMTALTYQINPKWRIKAAGFFAQSRNRPFGIWFQQPDSAGGFGRNSYGFYQRANNATATAELTGVFYTGPLKHQVLLGAEHQSTRQRYTNAGELSLLDSSNIHQPVYGNVSAQPPTSPFQPYAAIIKRKGFFLQDQVLLFNERLQILLGLRIGSTQQGNVYEANGGEDQLISKTLLTPRVGAVYKLRKNISAYASYSEGYEINSADVFAKNFRDYLTPPATLSRQVEVGLKSGFWNHRLGVMLSLFEINKRNPYGYVYLNPDNPNYDEYNVYYDGQHRSRGMELEATGQLSRQLSITAATAYTVTRVISDPGYPAGNRLPNAPKFTANAWLNFSPANWLKGLSIGGGIFYKDSFYSSLANNPLLKIPAGYRMDLAAGYSYKQFGAQLNIRNLTNQRAYLNPWQFNLFEVQPLRQFVLTCTYRIGWPGS